MAVLKVGEAERRLYNEYSEFLTKYIGKILLVVSGVDLVKEKIIESEYVSIEKIYANVEALTQALYRLRYTLNGSISWNYDPVSNEIRDIKWHFRDNEDIIIFSHTFEGSNTEKQVMYAISEWRKEVAKHSSFVKGFSKTRTSTGIVELCEELEKELDEIILTYVGS